MKPPVLFSLNLFELIPQDTLGNDSIWLPNGRKARKVKQV